MSIYLKWLNFQVICTLKVETCSGTLTLVSKFVVPVSVWRCVSRPRETTLRDVVRYRFYHQCNGCYRCRNRQRFYFTWYLPYNGSSKKFHETDHITRCNTCWNLFRSAIARQFHLKVSTCNSRFIYEIALLCHVWKKTYAKPVILSAEASWNESIKLYQLHKMENKNGQ